MARFVIVDPSLERPGGHHFEYAVHMAREAAAAGLDVLVAAHRRFPVSLWPGDAGTIVPVFPHTTYSAHTFDRVAAREAASARPSAAHPLRRVVHALRDRWLAVDRRRRTRGDEIAWHRLLDVCPLQAGDCAFCPTLSDVDFEVLSRVLAARPETEAVGWHLQFHFDILDGRASDYSQQTARIDRVRARFADCLGRLHRHDVAFYATTREMAEQYNAMQVAEFQELPYSVNPQLAPPPFPYHDGPLRMTCAGYSRREKGKWQLQRLVQELAPTCLANHKARLRVHGASYRLRRHLARTLRDTQAAVDYVAHPLSEKSYVELIRSSDIGVFLYDSESYRHRCSGVLVEMLMAGVPVVVPAGCWLGEQIAEPTQEHLAQLVSPGVTAPRPVVSDPVPLIWRPEGALARFESDGRLVVHGGSHAAVADGLSVERQTTELITECAWLAPTPPGSFLRLDLEQYAADGRRLDCSSRIVGSRGERGGPVRAHFPMHGQACRLLVRARNAFCDLPLSTCGWQWRMLDASHLPTGSSPGSQVGIAVADPDHFASAVEEMVRHYEHYRQTAIAFSHAWRQQHHPSHALQQVLGRRHRPAEHAA